MGPTAAVCEKCGKIFYHLTYPPPHYCHKETAMKANRESWSEHRLVYGYTLFISDEDLALLGCPVSFEHPLGEPRLMGFTASFLGELRRALQAAGHNF